MATLRDLATDALLDLGVLAAGETGTADDLLNALRAVNRLVDQWAAERLAIYTVTATTWTIVSGTQTYTVGVGGSINVARPVFVNDVRFLYNVTTPPVEFPLTALTDADWSRVVIKTLQAVLPREFYYNPTYPLGTLKLWPVPTSSDLTGILYAPTAVAEFASIDSTVALPPGYRRMIVKNLAVEMAPSYQRQVQGELAEAAKESKTRVKAANFRQTDMSFDPFALVQGNKQGTYNIRTDR